MRLARAKNRVMRFGVNKQHGVQHSKGLSDNCSSKLDRKNPVQFASIITTTQDELQKGKSHVLDLLVMLRSQTGGCGQ